MALCSALLTTSVQAAPPEHEASDEVELDDPTLAPAGVLAAPLPSSTALTLYTPELLATPPMPAMLHAPVLAKRARDRTFDTSSGEVDPRVRKLPRTHRFRMAIHSQYVRLPQTPNEDTGETERFHFAPLMLDLAYQAQFLKYVMVRIAVAAGGNVANTRNAMPGVIFPQAYVGVQTKVIGVAFGYGFDVTLPPIIGATDGGTYSLQQPVITRNHVVMGEISATSRIDRVALTFSLSLGGVQSDLTHYETQNRKWRFYLGLQAGVFFDGTIRREKKARKALEGSSGSKRRR